MKTSLFFTGVLLFTSTLLMGQINSDVETRAKKPMFSIQEGAVKKQNVDGQKSNGFKVYPIPTENYLNLQSMIVGSDVKIIDLGGLVVLSFAITQTNQRIDISDLASGLYFLRVSYYGTVLSTIRIIKD